MKRIASIFVVALGLVSVTTLACEGMDMSQKPLHKHHHIHNKANSQAHTHASAQTDVKVQDADK